MSSSSDVTDAVAMEEDLGRVEKLEKLLRALQDIKRENVRLRDNFSELQGVHRELRESNAELEEENTALRTDLASREVDLSATVEELAQELEQSYRQFEEAKSHILTQTEAKALEERLRSEIEGPYLAKIDELDNAVHEKIEDCSELWKVQEVLKEELSSTTRRLRNEIQVHESRYSALLEEVEETKKVAELYLNDPNEVAKAKSELEVRCLNLEQQNKSLLDEVTGEREARFRAEAEAQKEVRALNDARAEWIETEAKARSRNEELARRADHLQEELRRSKDREAELGKALLDAQREASMQKSELESSRVRFDADRALAESRLAKVKSELGRDKRALESSVTAQEKRIALLTAQHMREVKSLNDGHRDHCSKLEQELNRIRVERVEAGAKDRSEAVEARREAAKYRVELDAASERSAALERANSQLRGEAEKLRDERDCGEEAERRLQADLARSREEAASAARELEKQTDVGLRSSSEADRLGREAKRLRGELEQAADQLREAKREHDLAMKERERELEESRRARDAERAAGAKRQDETTQAAIRTYVGANAKLKRKLGKSEESASRLEREYTLLLIRVAELEAERKELRMQLNFGLSDLGTGSLGLASNLRTMAAGVVREAEDSNEDDVALALAAVGA